MGSAPRVSISLASWNGMHWLPACLRSVMAQSFSDFELLIIDDASTDGSLVWLREQAERDSRIDLRIADQNLGYAAAHNRCLAHARGEIVLLLNQDAVLDPGFLEAAVRALEAHPEVGSVQGRVLRLGVDEQRTDVVDTTGLVMHRDRRVVSRDQLRDDAAADRPRGAIWGVDGPVAVHRRAALESARLPGRGGGSEVLDEDFYMQKEDVDLAWRLRRLGWEARYEPEAVAWHARGGADSGDQALRAAVQANMAASDRTRVLAWRNQRLMQVKNDESRAVLRDLPWIIKREIGQLLFMLLADQRRLRAIPELLRTLPWAMRKRRALDRAVRARPRVT